MSRKNPNDFSKPHTPTERTGFFRGERGNSDFVPKDARAAEKLNAFGTDHVTYKKGYPDFSPFTKFHDDVLGDIDGQVQIPHMTEHRQNPHYEYGRRTDGHDPHASPGNFSQADNELAEKLNKEKGTSLTGEDIQKLREENNLTWHEVEDGKTMQLLPAEIHDACRHSGGVSIEKDLQRIIENAGDVDFDTGEPNAMDYTYNEETGELIPILHKNQESTPVLLKDRDGDDYRFESVVDANGEYGDGGAKQYFIPDANNMKKDGRLVVVDQEQEDPEKRTGPGQRNAYSYVNEDGVTVHVDKRPLDEEEAKQLAEGIPEEPVNYDNYQYDDKPLTEEEIADLDANTRDELGLNRADGDPVTESYRNPHSNQQDSGGMYQADGWQDPTKMQDGEYFYQLSVDGDTRSAYFTDEQTVDGCRREDGSVDFDQLREKLQVADGDSKVTLTKYRYDKPQEYEKTPNETELADGDGSLRKNDGVAVVDTKGEDQSAVPDTPVGKTNVAEQDENNSQNNAGMPITSGSKTDTTKQSETDGQSNGGMPTTSGSKTDTTKQSETDGQSNTGMPTTSGSKTGATEQDETNSQSNSSIPAAYSNKNKDTTQEDPNKQNQTGMPTTSGSPTNTAGRNESDDRIDSGMPTTSAGQSSAGESASSGAPTTSGSTDSSGKPGSSEQEKSGGMGIGG